MAIYNLNPRRVVWFSPNEPSNKYDIWLSRNAHLDENGEPTTDSNSQRDCDYIFKIYDCGKWNPIVGFNSTAANKIDIVEGTSYTPTGESQSYSGKTLYHPAIFTDESPNELYDAGTLGSLLSNLNFVSELEWYDVFNSTDYSWGNIFGDTNWFSNLTWSVIQGGSSTYQLPWATTERCGGILSATHTLTADAFKPIEVKFYPTGQNIYPSLQHRLCVSAREVIDLINSYYNDNPGGSSININWNSTTIHQLAEVLYNIFKNSSSLGFDDTWSLASDPHVYPHIWGVSSTNAGRFLRINPEWVDEEDGWSQQHNNMDWVNLSEIIPDLVNDEDIFVPKGGINISYVAPHGDDRQYVEWGLNHIEEATDGQYCRKITDNGVADIEWVDLPTETAYTPGTGITISQLNEISIKTDNALTGQVLTKTVDGVDWETPLQGATYTAGAGIEIDENQNNAISQHVERVEIGTPPSQLYVTYTGARDALLINGSSYGITVNSFDFYYNPTATDYTFTLVSNGQQFFSTNPIYLRINANYIELSSGTNYISSITPTNGRFPKGEYFVTIQFGFVKLELINAIA